MNMDQHLRELWQASDPVDTQAILGRLHRMEATQQRVNWIGFIAGMFFIALIVLAEWRLAATGSTAQWWVPISLAVVMTGSWANHLFTARRLQARIARADPRALLRFTIGRAKAGLWLARGLYAGFPLGMVAGVITSRLLHGDDPSFGLPMALRLLVILAALAGLIGGVWQGLRLARLRREDIRELTARLAQAEQDL
ncbi:MAG: hypothetical protein AAF184_05675 [Pseudomonadota bacterium]